MKLFPILAQWAFDPDVLGRRMSFISGPRQVGKTTLALLFLKKIGQQPYEVVPVDWTGSGPC